MVAGHPTIFLFGVFKHREVDNPQRAPAFFKETVLLAEFAVTNLQTQSAEAVVNDLGFIGTEEDHVTGLSACDFNKFGGTTSSERFFTTGPCMPSRPAATSLILM